MTHSIDTPLTPPDTPGSMTGSHAPSTSDAATSQVAKEEARNVGQTAAQAGGQVVSTAGDQAKEVAAETQRQARDLMDQGRTQLREQAMTQQQKAAGGLTSLGRELRGMADGTGDGAPGPGRDLVHQAAGKLEDFGSWLQQREPADLLDEVRRYARRKPGTFLLGAAVAGVLVGRLTRGVKEAHSDSGQHRMTGGPTPGMPGGQRMTGDQGGLSDPMAGAAYSEVNYVDPAPTYTGYGETQGTYGTTPGHGEPHGTYGTTPGTGAPLPPPPYGTVPPAGSVVPPNAPAGWEDPSRRPGEEAGR